MERTDLLSFATIGRTHGVRGELRVHVPEDLDGVIAGLVRAGGTLIARCRDGDERRIAPTSYRGAPGQRIIGLDGIDTPEDAAVLVGAAIAVPRELLPPLEDDEFYLVDVVGCIVYDHATGERIGTAGGAQALPAGTVVSIEIDAGGEVLAPVIGDAMPVLDVAGRRIEVDAVFLGIGEDS